MLILRSILVCVTLAFCSCATSPDVNQHKWDVEISPVDGKYATFALLVQRKHSEHRGNSKGENSVVVVASAGEGRKISSFGHGINYARYYHEAGLKVFWINDYYVKAEYDARYRVTGVDNKVFDDQSVKGVTRFCVKEGRHNLNLKVDTAVSSNQR